ncbi:MAG: hypothetical protein RJA07_1144 [Bacteroidota bacterium]|jgi:hypothetical protein
MKKIFATIILVATFCSIVPFTASAQHDEFLTDLINLWNNHKYEKVYQPLKEYKDSKKIQNDFEMDYMIATSAARSAGEDPKEVSSLINDLLANYKFKKDDQDYIRNQDGMGKYEKGKNTRMDAEHIGNRGKSADATNKEVPKSLGKNTDKTETKEIKEVGKKEMVKEEIKKDDEPVKDEVKKEVKKEEIKKEAKLVAKKDGDNKPTEIIRKPNVTQIVKGDKVITVMAGHSYFVRGDTIIEMPPVKSFLKK